MVEIGKKIKELKPLDVKFIPEVLEEGILYVSHEYGTAVHLCCCGCGNQTVTPFFRGGWVLSERLGKVTLRPSIGNWAFPCRSHYWITENRVEWC